MKIFVPPIKSQGIKTKLVPWIKDIIPQKIEGTWIEPFMGTGVVAFNMRPDIAILSDSNPHLINFYNAIKENNINPNIVRHFLEEEGDKLLHIEDYYYEVRQRFNEEHNPLDFLFINRAGFNGMIRFNKKGGHNVPFCKKPNRFTKSYVTKIVNQVDNIENIIKNADYSFVNQDFRDAIKIAKKEDIIYCDPPYIDRYVDYYNGWNEVDENSLNKLLNNFEGKFILSTWHSNKYRENKYLKTIWKNFNIITKEHFYHLGGSESNRNSMLEALILNHSIPKIKERKVLKQATLF
ncbi:Modification methylase EcoRV (Adenine-specific methyltransferase EcoRV) (M.EcoRV) [hydrothermal vent metagenome]|uniref:site-specific DNA-methyltransferase (adenine-specific) n=1 Tax=hydrothermal vent metagenome TaxID=652676 RepID=A0A1W1BZ64_9ZZZZ